MRHQDQFINQSIYVMPTKAAELVRTTHSGGARLRASPSQFWLHHHLYSTSPRTWVFTGGRDFSSAPQNSCETLRYWSELVSPFKTAKMRHDLLTLSRIPRLPPVAEFPVCKPSCCCPHTFSFQGKIGSLSQNLGSNSYQVYFWGMLNSACQTACGKLSI